MVTETQTDTSNSEGNAMEDGGSTYKHDDHDSAELAFVGVCPAGAVMQDCEEACRFRVLNKFAVIS